ncbi:MAG: RsbRD N-terminal domain-containing protein [Desulfobulbaceae bacterium]|uniref:RsbRD N-terminal domain-containing protein n=1 Tax=Candidatus Desulfobia pelagia TaxID=2841692 RepID=A0A8J6NCF8_9BACT|nr:RsbRD N-terminal domain-containing protein [Candidatus Desulfobia pelagia]
MQLDKLLVENREIILKQWKDCLLTKFAPETILFFQKQKDQFANPMGHKISVGLAELFDVICDTSSREVETPSLGQLIKLRAVQQVSASDAVSFVIQLKKIVRKECLSNIKTRESYEEWLAFDVRVDTAVLAVFDMFMASREQIYKVRVNELSSGRLNGAVCPSAMMKKEQEQQAQAAADIPALK